MNKYDDIINLSRPKSKRRNMNTENRAAQFIPFSALRGYNEACLEVERVTDSKIILCSDAKEIISNKLSFICENLKNINLIKIKYFVKDTYKKGGIYKEYLGKVKKINVNSCFLYMDNNLNIFFDDILEINIID